MKSERAADLRLTRELTERQQDQATVEAMRAENLRRANGAGDLLSPFVDWPAFDRGMAMRSQ